LPIAGVNPASTAPAESLVSAAHFSRGRRGTKARAPHQVLGARYGGNAKPGTSGSGPVHFKKRTQRCAV